MLVTVGPLVARWHRHSDLGVMTYIHSVCYPDEEWTANDFERWIDVDGNVSKVLTLDGVNVGTLLYSADRSGIRLRRIGVLPRYRQRGVARRAVESLVGCYSPMFGRRTTLLVKETNVTALSVVHHLGFGVVTGGLVVGHYRDGRDAVLYEYGPGR
jgi:ribosomal protein S18 acetylase RimI-like enzyme